jgi:DNA-binding NtrC family response regulator
VSSEPTIQSQPSWALPVRSIREDVTEGPDAGRSFTSDRESLTIGTADGNDLTLADPTVSRYHADVSRHASGGVAIVDHGSTNGTFVGAVRIERVVVPAGTYVRLGGTTLRISDGDDVALELHTGERLAGLLGRTPVMRRLMAQIEKLAATTAPVLLIGESGTGKEVIAKALHDLGPRAGAPFVTVDSGSLAPNLVASELFGHERGAFTGADRQHIGAFESASGGTVFLDELGELPVHIQPTLLGVLERRRFRRLGGRTDIPVDVRVISATHRDLRAEVNAGTFRLDLYYRVAVATLKVPALRERVDDIPLLAAHFAKECGHEGPIEALMKPGALDALSAHHWPGNVRELRNLVEATIATGEAPAIDKEVSRAVTTREGFDDLFAPLLSLGYKEARATLLEAFESRYFEMLLEKTGGNVSRAAREAHIDRSHLIDLLKRHGIKT